MASEPNVVAKGAKMGAANRLNKQIRPAGDFYTVRRTKCLGTEPPDLRRSQVSNMRG
ncbi:MAG TPA: hypothetical protein VIE13_01530 [Terriglobales bacterium]